MPVLPATVTPGIAAAVPVPSVITSVIISFIALATERGLTVVRCGEPESEKVGRGRRPPLPIVDATIAISRADA